MDRQTEITLANMNDDVRKAIRTLESVDDHLSLIREDAQIPMEHMIFQTMEALLDTSATQLSVILTLSKSLTNGLG